MPVSSSIAPCTTRKRAMYCTYNYECEIETYTARNHRPNNTKYQEILTTYTNIQRPRQSSKRYRVKPGGTTAKRVHCDSHISVMISTDIRVMSILRRVHQLDWHLCAITCLGVLMRVRSRIQVTVVRVVALEG